MAPRWTRYIWSIHHQATIRAKHGTRKVHLNSWSRPSLFLPDIGQFPAWPPDGPVYVEHSPPVLHLDQTLHRKSPTFPEIYQVCTWIQMNVKMIECKNKSCQKTTILNAWQTSLYSSQGLNFSKVGQTSRSRSQGQKWWHQVKGLVTRNTRVQYESSISSGLKVMTKDKVFVYASHADIGVDEDARAMTLSPWT